MTNRILLFALLLIASWSVMAVSHECGHIVGGMACGATLIDYDIVPWHLPYSLHSPDPHPLVTLWSGPLVGVAIPLLVAAVLRRRWAWFIADFCLIANGCYLALAWVSGDRLLDTPRLLNAGASPTTIVLYCLVTIGTGYVWFRADCIHFLSDKRKMVATENQPTDQCEEDRCFDSEDRVD
ncbi:hypothetical protein FF011L_07000 [Roseimaritima multifibrata]|uniref:Peptidase family M50 n=1 Tax=Roseimaritima multifibrata TaxID=1930274 RepID=A0A517MAQ6_9BACT|nr:hypothetical protein [Roseimaritima multifibrata]QDS91964.1 hypothetical protein FF011L_07000 [Roseimaritima multifibrata]